jgi:hypothetical protein
MSNLSHYASVVANPPSPPEHSGSGATPDGYVSDGLVQTSNNARERKKGMYADFFFFFSPCISCSICISIVGVSEAFSAS